MNSMNNYILFTLFLLILSCSKDEYYIIKEDTFNELKVLSKTHKDSLNINHVLVYDKNYILEKKFKTINGLKNGKEISYYKNGNKKYEVNFIDDTLNGESKFYYNNKKNSIEGIYYYEKGKIIGNQIKYYPNGNPEYHLGLLNNGDVAFRLLYSKSGKIVKEGRYKIMGVFDNLNFSSKEKIKYKVYFATPIGIKLNYNYSLNNIKSQEKWKSIELKNSILNIEMSIPKKGKYLFKERLEIFDVKQKTKVTENYEFTFDIK
ncbi:hypothetical protein NHF50_00150 [Flavobacterium sp. NRK F10]|uniref:toxin-antitoxin system YwqK family antitoxin n=1 Tax=Flavobacterium sp. NRK F10 TaxID=2954931 RepID=UPI002090B040|nr:hypothetical protein [Flavobacterium sp. NRK F10]MCO6173446.1 hypothetical protein [Flavobacterium sp. NRK F10]